MVVDLTGEWRLADEGDDSSSPMLVPGDEISALEAGLISDLYSGCNEYDLRCICDRAWMISRSLVMDDPVVWWPAGSGAQVLHDLVLTHKAQQEHRKCGLRDSRLIAEIAAAGLGFKFAINGRDIFARGANWVAADVLAGRITPEKIHRMLHSAVDANMNMIRVWDGGRYEPRWFYDLCDELCDDLGLTPATSAPTPQFTLRDLHSTTFSPV